MQSTAPVFSPAEKLNACGLCGHSSRTYRPRQACLFMSAVCARFATNIHLRASPLYPTLPRGHARTPRFAFVLSSGRQLNAKDTGIFLTGFLYVLNVALRLMETFGYKCSELDYILVSIDVYSCAYPANLSWEVNLVCTTWFAIDFLNGIYSRRFDIF